MPTPETASGPFGGPLHDDLHDYATAAHAHLIGLPAALDMKAGALAAAALLAIALRGRALAGQPISAAFWQTDVAIAGVALLAAGAGMALCALAHHAHGRHDNPFSVHGFAAHPDSEAMLAVLRERAPHNLLEDRLRHCREVAIVTLQKAKWFHRALACGAAGAGLTGLSTLG